MLGGATLSHRREQAVIEAWRHPGLRRLTLGWGCFFLVDWLVVVGVSVWAYRDVGPAAVGVVGLARHLTGAFAVPVGAWISDRVPRPKVLVGVFVVEAIALAGVVAAMAGDAPPVVVFGLVALVSISAAPYRPASLSLVPLIARSSEELVAANVSAGLTEGTAVLVGPAVAAVLLLIATPAAVLVAAGLAALFAVVVVSGLHVETDPTRVVRANSGTGAGGIFEGFVVLARDHDLAVIVICFVLQLFVRGILLVLLVSISIELVGLGNSGVGWLAAAMGLGGLVGGAATMTLTGRRRLGRPFRLGLVLWGAPLLVIGAVPDAAVALVALAVVGVGNAVLGVSGFALLQRLGDDRTLGRVFGVLYTGGKVLAAVGSLLAPVLVHAFGIRPSLLVVGAILPALALAVAPRLRLVDAHAEPPAALLAAIQRVPLLAPLPPTSLEKLAARSMLDRFETGDVIVREGDTADRFFVIADGTVAVERGGRVVDTMAAGEHFGEVGLLHQAPRNATIAATSPTTVVVLEGEDFIAAITANDSAFDATFQIADDRGGRGRFATGGG